MSANDKGCLEYRTLSRRKFLKGAGTATAIAFAPAWLPRVSLAESYSSTRDVIVQVYLRGGADGLTLCVPFGDPGYYSARPTLRIPPPDSTDANRAINLNGFFGLPPAMAQLLEPYQTGNLAFVHATGLVANNRSHFDSQHFMELGVAGNPNVSTGWLGRHLASVAPLNATAPLRAVGISFGLQETLAGGPKSLPIPDLANYNLTGRTTTRTARMNALRAMYDIEPDPLRASAQNTEATIALLQQINFTGYVPAGGAVYPATSFGTAMKSTAALIKSDKGVEAVAIDVGGWDTHSNQGPIVGGMATIMTGLANALNAFHMDMGTTGHINSVTVVLISEFGRNVRENGSFGTDHGHGNCMIVMGGSVVGGQVMTSWPGLGAGQLYQNQDLRITIDHRDILSEVVAKRLGNSANLSSIFPGHTYTDRGLFT